MSISTLNLIICFIQLFTGAVVSIMHVALVFWVNYTGIDQQIFPLTACKRLVFNGQNVFLSRIQHFFCFMLIRC